MNERALLTMTTITNQVFPKINFIKLILYLICLSNLFQYFSTFQKLFCVQNLKVGSEWLMKFFVFCFFITAAII